MYSKLIKKEIKSPNYSSRNGQKVCKITIHHAAGIINGEPLANIFKNPKRQASCNYAIGNDGVIIGVVPEEFRSWCSGNRANDEQAITIEVGNSSGKPMWEIGEKAMNSLIALCIDICKRYKITPFYNGSKTGSFTFHCMFQATECPGTYIKGNIYHIITEIEKGLKSEKPSEPSEPSENFIKVKVTASDLNIRSGSGTKYKKVGHITDKGIYTIVEKNGNWGKLKSGAGWICLKYTKEV